MKATIEVGDLVDVPDIGRHGEIIAMFGVPISELLLNLFPGAIGGYEYVTYRDKEGKIVMNPLNRISIYRVRRRKE